MKEFLNTVVFACLCFVLVAAGESAFAQTGSPLDSLLNPKPAAQAPLASSAQAAFQKRFENAVKLQQAGKLDAAMSEYKALRKMAPNHPGIITNMGILYAAKNQLGPAETALRQAVKLDAKNTIAMEMLTRVLMMRKKFGEAVSTARRIVSANPKNPRAQALLGVAAMQARDARTAAKAFQAVLSINPKDENARLNLSQAYAGMNDFPKALATLKQVMAKGSNPQLEMAAGYLSERAGDKRGAIRYYSSAADEKVYRTPALLSVARVQSSLGEEDKSAETFIKILDTDPTNYDANVNLGRYYFMKDKAAGAQQYLKAALKARPDNPMVNVLMSLTLGRLNKPVEAEAAARKALKASPNDRSAMEALGSSLEAQRKLDDALKVYTGWEKQLPKDFLPNYKKALAYSRKGDQKNSRAQFKLAHDKSPKNFDVLLAYAGAVKGQDDYANAAILFRRALLLKPNDLGTTVGLSDSLFGLNKKDEAVSVLKELVVKQPKNPDAYSALASMYEKQTLPKQALEQYQRILTFAPKDQNALQSIARMQEKSGNFTASADAYRKLRDAYPEDRSYTYYASQVINMTDKAGKPDDAIAEARKLVESKPKEASFRNQLADLLTKKKDYDGAIAQVEELTKSDDVKTRTNAYAKIGGILEEQAKLPEGKFDPSKIELAIASYKKAIDASPSSTPTLKALQRIYADQKKQGEYQTYLKDLVESGKPEVPYGFYYEAMKGDGKPDEAVKVLEAIQKKPNNDNTLAYALGTAYGNAGEHQKALDQFNRLIAKNAKDTSALRAAAKTYNSMGEKDKAIETWRKAYDSFNWDPSPLKEIGDIYDSQGKKAEAIKTYEEYLKQWQDDPATKKRLEDLKNPKPAVAPTAPATPVAPAIPATPTTPEPPK